MPEQCGSAWQIGENFMSDALRMWILTLSGIIVFGSLSEMLLPGGVYKKYVQLAVGLMLTTAVLKPLAEGFPEEVSLPAMNAYEQSMDMDTKQRADVLKILSSTAERQYSRGDTSGCGSGFYTQVRGFGKGGGLRLG